MEQKIGIDTVIVIYLLEEHPVYLPKVEGLFKRIEAGRVEAVFSSIGLVELFTGLKRAGRYDLAFYYHTLLGNFPHLTIAGMNERIVEIASDLRAHYTIATPDAIHIATAIDFGAEEFITNDTDLQRVKEISVRPLNLI